MNITHHANHTCPFLGLENDADSSQAFPSIINFCYRSTPAAPVKLNHQTQFCLSRTHPKCLVFLRQQAAPLPSEIRAHYGSQKKIRRRVSQRNIIAVIIALAVIVLFEWQFFTQINPPSLKVTAQTRTATIQPSETLTPFPTHTATLPPIAITNTPTLHIPFFGSVTVTNSPTTMPSSTPTKFISNHQLDVEIGTDQKFIIHRLAEGENLDAHVLTYNTSIKAVIDLNYYLYLTNPVHRDVLIIFPLNFTDVSGLHILNVYQMPEIEIKPVNPELGINLRGINYEDLAHHLRVNLNDFKYYNGITDPSDRPLVGNYYLIPEKRLTP